MSFIGWNEDDWVYDCKTLLNYKFVLNFLDICVLILIYVLKNIIIFDLFNDAIMLFIILFQI